MATLYYRPYTTELSNDPPEKDLPKENAIESILPDYEYILERDYNDTNNPLRPNLSTKAPLNLSNHEEDNSEHYRAAVKRMGHDILALRDRMRQLQEENARLRHEVNAEGDSSKILLDSVELDGLPKTELIRRYVSLKQQLTGQDAELLTYKQKVQKLQNELIKKNAREEEFIKVSNAHTSQQRILHDLQEKVAKVKKLEETVLQQERVIARMEKVLEQRANGAKEPERSRNVKSDESLTEALTEENRHLRQELAALKKNNKQENSGSLMDDSERFELYQLLDKAESRIISLEKQLRETSGKWGREKEKLNRSLKESQQGFYLPLRE